MQTHFGSELTFMFSNLPLEMAPTLICGSNIAIIWWSKTSGNAKKTRRLST